jgi:hypothetical protein
VVTGQGQMGPFKAEGQVKGPGYDLDGIAKASLSTFGFDINVGLHVDAHAAKANAVASTEIPFTYGGQKFKIKVDLGGKALAGVEGDLILKIHFGLDGKPSFEFTAGGFAGAKGQLIGDVRVEANGKTLVDADAAVTFYAGVAGKFEFGAGWNWFKLKAHASAGTGVGIDLHGSVNPQNIIEMIPALAAGIGWDVFTGGGKHIAGPGTLSADRWENTAPPQC